MENLYPTEIKASDDNQTYRNFHGPNISSIDSSAVNIFSGNMEFPNEDGEKSKFESKFSSPHFNEVIARNNHAASSNGYIDPIFIETDGKIDRYG